MRVRVSRWHEESVGIERGPLVYALRIREDWVKQQDRGRYSTYAVLPKDPWNYALVLEDLDHPAADLTVEREKMSNAPWTVETAPLHLKAKAKQLPEWKQYNGAAGPLPWSPVWSRQPEQDVVLIPYGCSRLRIAEFPFVERQKR